MKKIFYLAFFGIVSLSVNAQEIQDAIRYSQQNLTGTARFRAMGGAFGALGGDLSAITINPASSAVFTYNQIGVTLSNFNIKNKSNYFGSSATERENTFDINQLGAVFVFEDFNSNQNWKKISVGLNYDNTNSFNNALFSAGVNPTNSVDQYFLSYANGIPLNAITNNPYSFLNFAEQQAYMGFEGYIFDPLTNDPSNNQYVSNVPAGGNYYQENFVTSRGINGKLSFNAAAQYKDNVYVGLNLNAHFIDYTQNSRFFESNTNDSQNGVQRLRFENSLYTYGNGFSFQLGTIVKVTDELRAGFTFESPTWFYLNDETSQFLVAENRTDGQSFTDVVDPQIINIFPAYRLQTPGKITGSLAYVFLKRGIISFDYSLKDYSNMKFRPTDDLYFSDLNREMASILTMSNEFRVGAEYKIKQLSLRGGYRFEESPFKNSETLGNLSSFSTGLGYNFGTIKADLAYANTKQNRMQGFFSQGLTDAAAINSVNNTITLSLLFEL
ncbi:OmpP1/FadL family transporter [Flavobacterium sp. UBA6135]|uniref:OmpP1/FadL family transporter n=1 Tax=Flavobacterium sp. UBA6135 TaxID=1946553 RepID=UPI0025C0701F|nr:outer membrane protein transport protein [Flavobacterium sp. UBA6135]